MRITETIATALMFSLMLTGATCQTHTDSGGYTAHCNGIELCKQDCKALADWDGSKDDASLQQLLDQHSDAITQCNAQRGICAQCLDAIERAGVVVGDGQR